MSGNFPDMGGGPLPQPLRSGFSWWGGENFSIFQAFLLLRYNDNNPAQLRWSPELCRLSSEYTSLHSSQQTSTQPVMIYIESCMKYAGSLALPRTRATRFGGGVAAAFVTVFLLKKVYKRVQVGRNVKKVKTKRENLAARKRGLEERSPLHRVISTFDK